jgi:hypothetical protein
MRTCLLIRGDVLDAYRPAVIHDYKRNGTASLFAALNTVDSKVISLCQERHRHQEWIKFLRLVDDATPSHKQLHLVADYYATHKHPKVQSGKLKAGSHHSE